MGVPIHKTKKDIHWDVLFLVREAGVEPARPCEHWHLKPASLPIPPLAQVIRSSVAQGKMYNTTLRGPCQQIFSLFRRKSCIPQGWAFPNIETQH